MFVVLDSNIWISQVGLKSAQAVEVLNYMQVNNATLVVPSVVRREVEIKLSESVRSHGQKIENSSRFISTILKTVEVLEMPSDTEIKECVKALINEVEIPVRDVPLSLDAVEISLNKILHKLPPSDKREEFVDGVIWANCLGLLDEAEVFLVTADRAFYQNRQHPEGLEQTLTEEARACQNELHLFPSLDRFLDSKHPDVQRVWSD